MTDPWVRGQRSEPKIQTHTKVSAETEGKCRGRRECTVVARQGSYRGEGGGWADFKDDWQAKGGHAEKPKVREAKRLFRKDNGVKGHISG